MKIKQAFVAPSIKFFRNNFLSTNNLVDYYDDTEPAVFFGCGESSSIIRKHKGYKILLPCRPNDYPLITNYDKSLFICSDNYNLPENVIRKNITPRIKDYNDFKPVELGDKIYFYSGFKNGNNLVTEKINEIQKNINYEIITTNHNYLNDYYNIKDLKKDYYDKCFLNLNLTNGSGLATVIELGLMGRKTIFKNSHVNNIQRMDFPNFIDYNNIEDIIHIINEESKKIGTIQPQIDAHNVGEEWLDLDFWL
jgi:hypothetical protein